MTAPTDRDDDFDNVEPIPPRTEYDDDVARVDQAEVRDDDTFEELGLVEDDAALPWLETDYDDEPAGVDTGRIVGFVLLSLVTLALILAAIWYFLRDRADPDLQPEGTTIAAPEGPIRERPEDAGGQTFEGTGNVAPTVGEGQADRRASCGRRNAAPVHRYGDDRRPRRNRNRVRRGGRDNRRRWCTGRRL